MAALVLDLRDLHPAQEMSAKPTEVDRTWLVQMAPLVAVASPVFYLFWDPYWVAAAVVVVMVVIQETIAVEVAEVRLVLMS